MNFLRFGPSADIDIVFDGTEGRKTVEFKGEDGKVEQMLLYYDGETVSGKVNKSFSLMNTQYFLLINEDVRILVGWHCLFQLICSW